MGENHHYSLAKIFKYFGLVFLLFSVSPAFATTGEQQLKKTTESTIQLDRDQLEKKLGRKLNFKERWALRILKSKVNRKKTDDEGKNDTIDGFAITALVLGIVSLISGVVGIFLGILAVIFGAISLVRIRKNHTGGYAMALAGLICGILGVVLWSAFIFLLLFGGGFF